ncbi:MAG: hypothetical protein AAF693_19295 [Bacteroidota bacterium]
MKYDIKLPDGTPVDTLIPEELVKDRLEVMKIIYPDAKAFPNHDLEILNQLANKKKV